VIPPFIDAIDNATSWLAPDGFLAVSDFFVSARYDVPMRQVRPRGARPRARARGWGRRAEREGARAFAPSASGPSIAPAPRPHLTLPPTPQPQMNWGRRFFWRSIFDIDNIDIGPERRAYLETKLEVGWRGTGGRGGSGLGGGRR
jgi:hypothetical protein